MMMVMMMKVLALQLARLILVAGSQHEATTSPAQLGSLITYNDIVFHNTIIYEPAHIMLPGGPLATILSNASVRKILIRISTHIVASCLSSTRYITVYTFINTGSGLHAPRC